MSAFADWAVIPAFNEGGAIGGVVAKLLLSIPNVVVVDDCSHDETAEIALAAGHVCRHSVNLGQGAALQTGIDYALLNGASAVVTFDADGQHRVEDALIFLETLYLENLDVVLGSRFLGAPPLGMTRKKAQFLKLAVAYTRVTSGLRVTDTHNGLRALSRSAAQRIRLRQNRMAHASEFLDQIARLKLRYKELPCVVEYTEYSIQKGQRMTGAISILFDIYVRKLYK